jgi:hypothetical protein
MHLLFLSSSCAKKGQAFDSAIQEILTAWSKVLLLKLTIRHLVENFGAFSELKFSLAINPFF